MTVKRNKIVIGSRGSKLAMWQANWVKDKLQTLYPELKVEIEKIKTTGDKILDAPLAKIGGKGLFVKEIEEALLSKRVDLAVHSMKDVPTEIPEGLQISAICEREDPRDAFISKDGVLLNELPQEAVLGTSSLRRTVQLKALRNDLVIKPLRGNVDTRIRKLKDGEFQAIVLAMAGVKRMGVENLVTQAFSEDLMIPAIGQGAIGIETRVDDDFVNELIKPLNHEETAICILAERAFLSVMGGGCQVPLACHARIVNNSLKIVGMIGDPEGKMPVIKGFREGSLSQAQSLGVELANELLHRGGKEILEKVYK
ncbi:MULTISPECIES: hydroxymethylbilane synthase [Thermodesulfovibrio]|uniref:Porphobilinogen deaminase n=1 Tax=Thermodesulfovibrio yellowstonii (strain ATCC 51303 / DSM 11347 / YP87) TaxID=289376 RepID=B5YJZ4_THEYD|nr:porphobilinogen deaminase [Thermodesulfovibrio yellowstonii DSM 11347]